MALGKVPEREVKTRGALFVRAKPPPGAYTSLGAEASGFALSPRKQLKRVPRTIQRSRAGCGWPRAAARFFWRLNAIIHNQKLHVTMMMMPLSN